MKIRFGLLKRYLNEVLSGMEETDARTVGDDAGPSDENNDMKMSDHLMGDENKTGLGDHADGTVDESTFQDDLHAFFLQEAEEGGGEAAPVASSPGFYTPFDMVKDHTGTEDPNSTWYRSPGREPGADGDPGRSADPYVQLGMHSAKDGEHLAPQIWQLTAGSDTSAVLGANAKPAGAATGADGEQEEGEEGTDDGTEGGAEEGPPEGDEPDKGRPERGRDR